MTEKRDMSLMEVAFRNLRAAGLSRTRAITGAAKACEYIWAWAHVARDLGRDPTRLEYAQYWKFTERHAYQELDVFKRAFPTERDPLRLAHWLNDQFDDALVSDMVVHSVKVPASLGLA